MTPLNAKTLLWLCIAQGMALLPSFFQLPLWLPFFWCATVAWRTQVYRRALPLPSLRWKVLAAALGILALLFSFNRFFSVESFVTFFVIAFSLKLLELRYRRDGLMLVHVTFIGLAISFLFYQSLLMVIYALVVLVLVAHAWVMLYRGETLSARPDWRYALLLVVQTLPLMLVLFLTMPRMSQLWNMPTPGEQGRTGFSDSMSPGDFSNLVESDAVAFRVSFEGGQAPPPSTRYWRALVLEHFDGRSWHRQPGWRSSLRHSQTGQPPQEWEPQAGAERIQYSVLMEPHREPWLFSLMLPVSASSTSLNLRFTSFATLSSRTRVGSRVQYEVTSAPEYRWQSTSISSFDFRNNTQFPKALNPQTIAYGEGLRQTLGSGAEADREIIQRVLQRFHERFRYSLSPPALGEHAVDAFLFETFDGFCEHFAGAFTLTMRAAGIPARVVVGYQGGEWNPLESYLIVRQREAHAWAEVWLEGEGWRRVDPTAAVAPSRIERGLSGAVSTGEDTIDSAAGDLGLLLWMQLRLDAFSYTWQKFVLSYDSNVQQAFLSALLGGAELWRMGLFFVGATGSLILLYYLISTYWQRPKTRGPLDRALQRVLKQCATLARARHHGETLEAYLSSLQRSHPDLAQRLKPLMDRYQAMAYEPSAHSEEAIRSFRRACRRF